jgi:hypothetical protein
MTGLVRKATLLTAAGLLVASAAMAGVPSETNSTKPACITLVGSLAGVPDAAAGQFTIIVRDLANNPLNGASVVIDLSNANDLAICDDQLDANALVNCAAKTTRKFTDITGSVTFTVLGGSNGAGTASTLLNGGRIYANGTLIGSPTVAAYDLDGSSGVGANDLSAWLTDFGTGNPYGRSDFDCSGGVGANDLSFWLTEFGAGTSAASCSVSCP